MDNKLLIQDLAEAVATKEGLTKKKSEAFVKALFETIEEGLLTDKFVKIKGLGTFKIITVGERESVNINTGERFSIEGHEKITFTPDTVLKDLINRPFAHFQTVVINDDTNLEELENVDNDVEDSPEDLNTEEDTDENELKEFDNQAPLGKDASDHEEENLSEEEKQLVITGNVPLEKIDKNEELQDSTEEEKQQSVISVNNSLQDTEDHVLDSSQETPTEDHLEAVDNTSDQDPDNLEESQVASLANDNKSFSHDQVQEFCPKQNNCTDELVNEKMSTMEDADNKVHNEEDQPDQILPMKETTEPAANKKSEEKVALQEDTQQEIKYIIKDLENKRNTWKIISIILLSILLLFLSYFAGYFRWFCPCEILNNKQNQTILCPSPTEKDTGKDAIVAEPKDTITQSTDSVANKQAPPQEMQMEAEEPLVDAKPATQTSKSTTAPPQKTPIVKQEEYKERLTASQKDQLESQYNQVPGGRYKIVGTIKTHQIQNGETIRTIALDVYGSKGYAIYIIAHNNLENPNVVEKGTVLKLPKLERRKK